MSKMAVNAFEVVLLMWRWCILGWEATATQVSLLTYIHPLLLSVQARSVERLSAQRSL